MTSISVRNCVWESLRSIWQSGKKDWWMIHRGLTFEGVLRHESLLHVCVWRQYFGLVWFDFCFTALRHILGHSWISGRGRMAVEFFHDQVSTKECAGCGDRTRGRLHAKRTQFRSRYRALCMTSKVLETQQTINRRESYCKGHRTGQSCSLESL